MLILNPTIIPIRPQIHISRPNKPRALDKLPAQEHDNHDRDLDVIRHEIHALKVRAEAFPALHEHEHAVEADGEDGAVGVRPVLEGEEVFETLGADGAAEAEGGDADADPGELVGDADDAGFC